MNILVHAYQLSPYRGSEYSVAWNYLMEMGKEHSITVLYGANGNNMGDFDPVEDYRNLVGSRKITFVPVPCGFFANLLNQLNKHGVFVYSFYFAYNLWQKRVYKIARQLIRENHYDLIHFLGPIGYREPGYLWKLPLPYLWGPICGLNDLPEVCYGMLPPKTAIKYKIRQFFNNWQRRHIRRIKKAIQRADVLLTATTANQQLIRELYHRDAGYLPENGIFLSDINAQALENRDFLADSLQILWCGRLDGGKNLKTALQALARVKESIRFTLHVVGSGPLEESLKIFASESGIADSIVWHGQIPRKDVLPLWKNAHIHLLTSVFEANTTVVLEAMCNGVPTICFDTCGMHDTISDQAGILIPMEDAEKIPADFADAICKLAMDRTLLQKLSEQTLQRSYHYSFDERHKFFNKQYELAIRNFHQTKKEK